MHDELNEELIENLPPLRGKKTSSDMSLPKFRDSGAFSFDVRDNAIAKDPQGHLAVGGEGQQRQPSSFYRQAHN